MTARRGAAGIYLAYANENGDAISLWRYGDRAARAVVRAADISSVGIAPGPEGRLWVFWESGERYYATRSNREATRFGRVVSVAPPPGESHATYSLFGEGSLGPLDLLAHVATSPKLLATWHKRVLPGLTLTCAGASSISCRVVDAGDPVRGATIEVDGKTATTDASGRATIDLPRGRVVVRVTKPGYSPSTLTVRGT